MTFSLHLDPSHGEGVGGGGGGGFCIDLSTALTLSQGLLPGLVIYPCITSAVRELKQWSSRVFVYVGNQNIAFSWVFSILAAIRRGIPVQNRAS